MKIGILTYHSIPNFGANLQALSTVGFLKKNGIEPVVINWVPKNLESSFQRKISGEQYNKHLDFAKIYLPQTRLCRNEDDILEVIDELKIEGIIIGSDAVLHHIPSSRRRVFVRSKLKFVHIDVTDDRSFPNPYWGCFIPRLKKNIPVIGFSMSSQNMPYFDLNKEEISQIQNSLNMFLYITVRDVWTKKMIEYILTGNRSVPITPDPVFAFNNNNFLPVPEKEKILSKYNLLEKYVLISFEKKWIISRISFRWIKKIERLFKQEGIVCVALAVPEGVKALGLKHIIATPLETLDWYYLIKYSQGYIGERMHPVIVCMHNSVPFFSFDHYGTYHNMRIPFFRKYVHSSSKIYDILTRASLLEFSWAYYKLRRPSSKYVFTKIMNFDIGKCKKFADNYFDKYNRYMDQIIDRFSRFNS
jgi:polysaccharide pyruvyl transferase WcaK-like protein